MELKLPRERPLPIDMPELILGSKVQNMKQPYKITQKARGIQQLVSRIQVELKDEIERMNFEEELQQMQAKRDARKASLVQAQPE
jgi:hypothetical protein